MIEFVAGVCVGYFCRPVVAVVINFISDIWKKYQQKDDPDDPNITR